MTCQGRLARAKTGEISTEWLQRVEREGNHITKRGMEGPREQIAVNV